MPPSWRGKTSGRSRHSEAQTRRKSFAIVERPYDSHTDTLNVIRKDNVAVHESDEDKPGVIFDYDKEGDLISLKILDASQRVTDTRKVDFQLAESRK
jgi:uncharacterized protein YuzE